MTIWPPLVLAIDQTFPEPSVRVGPTVVMIEIAGELV
jgi:hypothetical protein